MTLKVHHTQIDPEGQATPRELLQENLKLAIQYTLIQALEEEVEDYIQAALHERTANRRDHRNGRYRRRLGTSMGEIEYLAVQRTRKGFQSQLLDRYRRRQAELDESICQMFVQGISTEKWGRIVESLSGSHPSPSTVSRVFHTLEEEFTSWKKHPLQAHYLYVAADGTYFSVIYDDQGSHMPILAAIGIDPEGRREVLGFSTRDRENQPAWEALLTDLKDRGLETVDLWISDGGKVMINAIESKFLNAKPNVVCSTKWRMSLAIFPTSNKRRSIPNCERFSIRTISKMPNKKWPPLAATKTVACCYSMQSFVVSI